MFVCVCCFWSAGWIIKTHERLSPLHGKYIACEYPPKYDFDVTASIIFIYTFSYASLGLGWMCKISSVWVMLDFFILLDYISMLGKNKEIQKIRKLKTEDKTIMI